MLRLHAIEEQICNGEIKIVKLYFDNAVEAEYLFKKWLSEIQHMDTETKMRPIAIEHAYQIENLRVLEEDTK